MPRGIPRATSVARAPRKRARLTPAGVNTTTANEINKSCVSTPEAFEAWNKITDHPKCNSVDAMLQLMEVSRQHIDQRVRTLTSRSSHDFIIHIDFNTSFWNAIILMTEYVKVGNATLAVFQVATMNVQSAVDWIISQVVRRAMPDGMQCTELRELFQRQDDTLSKLREEYEDLRDKLDRARQAIGKSVQEFSAVVEKNRQGFEVLRGWSSNDMRAIAILRDIGSSHPILNHFVVRALCLDRTDEAQLNTNPTLKFLYRDLVERHLCRFPTTPEEYGAFLRDAVQCKSMQMRPFTPKYDMTLRAIARAGVAIHADIVLSVSNTNVETFRISLIVPQSTQFLETWVPAHPSIVDRLAMINRILPHLTPGGSADYFDRILICDSTIVQLCDDGDFDVETRARMVMRVMLCDQGYNEACQIVRTRGDWADDVLTFSHADVPHYIRKRAAAGGEAAIYPTHDGVTNCHACMTHCSTTFSVSCAACSCVMCHACVVKACTATPSMCISDDYKAFMCPGCPNSPTRLAEFEKMPMLNHRREAVAEARIERAVQCTYVDAERRCRAEMFSHTRDMSEALEQALRTGLDDAMNLKCPSCSTVFVDHDACKALFCSKTACGARFCGFGCGTWFGKEDESHIVHNHCKQCKFNNYPDRETGEMSYSVPSSLWTTITERTAKRQVLAYVDSLSGNERMVLMIMRANEIRAATDDRIDAMCEVHLYASD